MARFFLLRNFLELIVDRCSLKKIIKNIQNIYVGEVDFSCLYKNYLLCYEKSNVFSVRYSFYLAFKNMVELVKPKVIIYPYENQPWEKLINKACYKKNIATIAINHPVICSDMFYLYNDANISEEYLPSCILVNGNIEENVIKAMNKYNDTKLYLIGSKRHLYPDMNLRTRVDANKYKVAIIFSGEISEYFDIVTSLNKSGDKLSSFYFYLKPPPGVYLANFLSVYDELQKQIKFKYSLFTDNLHQLFEKVETVVFLNTTVGIEAYIENKVCINYSTNYKYCLDLAESISKGIYYADSNSLPSILVETTSCEDNELINTEDYFKPWDKKRFSEVLTEMVGTQMEQTS